ncbi:hypothetical protein D5085_01740 [Ectothiorhodospiraceae bacterium BW-2]|nr:hypothetical protein D5085_01740 [Ectothiorhodospiraceae bacterium BW-2]
MAVKSSEVDRALGLFVADTIAEWHRSGFLLAKEAEWGLPPSPYLQQQNQLFNQLDADGELLCRRGEDNRFPLPCQNQKLLKEAGVETTPNFDGIRGWLVDLGIDFVPLTDPYAGDILWQGIVLTLLLSLIAIVGSLLFGLVAAYSQLRGLWPLGWLFATIVQLFQKTPPILQLYIIFFGLGTVAANEWNITFNAIAVAGVVFSLYAGASNAVALLHAMENIGARYPYDPPYAHLAEVIESAFSALVANSVNIVKAIGIASVIAVPELISATNAILSEHGNSTEMMNFLMLFYFLLVAVAIVLLNSLRRVVNRWAS